MITVERLNELIKQKSTIYEVKYGSINKVSLNQKIRWLGKTCITFEPNMIDKYSHHKYYNKLFETKEDAEWYNEFGNIHRIEKLPLPTWEEFKKMANQPIHFYDKDCRYSFYNNYVKDKNYVGLWCYKQDQDWCLIYEPLTEESYLKACRLCKKLFLGDSDDKDRN